MGPGVTVSVAVADRLLSRRMPVTVYLPALVAEQRTSAPSLVHVPAVDREVGLGGKVLFVAVLAVLVILTAL